MNERWFAPEIDQPLCHVDDFLIDVTPVTNRAYAEFVRDEGYERQQFWSDAGWNWLQRADRRKPRFWSEEWLEWMADDRPVIGVTWFESFAFSRWACKRLPTEAEWQLAAQGPDDFRRFPWGKNFELDRCNTADAWLGFRISDIDDWIKGFVNRAPWRTECMTTPVGSYASGASPYGVLDMAGNVWEWCDSWFLPGHKVCRGGSFGYPSWSARVSERGYHPPWWSALGLGFRCAASVLP